MNDARFQQNGQQPQQPPFQPTHPQPSSNSWRGLIAGVASLTRAGTVLVMVVGGLALLGEAMMEPDDPLRPANLYAALVGDARAGVDDRMRAVDVKWATIQHQNVEAINRETVAVTKEIEVRATAMTSKIEAVDRHQLPSLIGNIVGEINCARSGQIAGHCPETRAMRAGVIAERDALIGNVKILYSDEQLMEKIGLQPDFMNQFNPG